MKIQLVSKTECCGCGACANRCPGGCITMLPDTEGFLYPQIDPARCTECGLCEQACPVSHPVRGTAETPAAYGARAKDMDLRLKSSSGGVFSLLAERTLDRGGVVFGAALTPDCKAVRHIAVTERGRLAPLRGSKYLQSEIGDAFRQVLGHLEEGREVLFTGTPCQIDGLKRFLGRDRQGLLCMEVICHGVPSPALWERYIAYMGERSGAPIQKADFRHKKLSWTIFGARLENSKRRVLYSTLHKDPYLQMFLKNICLRPSCYQCPSRGLDRRADLTVGDFWGIENVAPELDDDKGTSLVLIHTEEGARAFSDISADLDMRRVDCMAALAGNICMLESVARPAGRERFFEDLGRMPFCELQRKYVPVTRKERAKIFLQERGLWTAVQSLRGKR